MYGRNFVLVTTDRDSHHMRVTEAGRIERDMLGLYLWDVTVL